MQIVRIHTGTKERPSAEVVGSKAANLAHMASLGLPVPPAFVIPIELCGAIVDGDPNAKQWLADGLASGISFSGRGNRERFRRSPAAAAGFGQLRRRKIDARHARHGA